MLPRLWVFAQVEADEVLLDAQMSVGFPLKGLKHLKYFWIPKGLLATHLFEASLHAGLKRNGPLLLGPLGPCVWEQEKYFWIPESRWAILLERISMHFSKEMSHCFPDF